MIRDLVQEMKLTTACNLFLQLFNKIEFELLGLCRTFRSVRLT